MLKVGVVIARFQVPRLHEGHETLLRAAQVENDEAIVLLGCSELDGRTPENPLLYTQREAVVRRVAPCIRIFPLWNQKSNKSWSNTVDMLVYSAFPECSARIYYGRGSVIPECYTGRAELIQVDAVPKVSGTALRAAIEPQTSGAFLEGQIYALNRQFPRVFPCVDIGVIKENLVLLVQRADTGAWCFPGGFVDPTDKSFEHAARRELLEETGLTCESEPQYVMSAEIHDWRYKGRDKIVSSLYAVPYCFGAPRVTPEITDWSWVSLTMDNFNKVDKCHQQFFSALGKRKDNGL